MVAIKQDLNAAEDLGEMQTRIEELTAGLADDADGSKQAEIGTLTTRKGELEARRQALEGEIAHKTELVTTTGAEALTISSRIANLEAALRLAAATSNLAAIDA
jgi:predicted  nucleic acid-binding Zn-ribbon protein